MAVSAPRKSDIIFVTDHFPNDATIHGRAMQTLVSDCLAQDMMVTVISLGPEKKDVWHKGRCHHIGLGYSGKTAGLLQSAKLQLGLRATLRKLPPHKILISDSMIGKLVFKAEQWAQKNGVRHIHWAPKIFPEAAAFDSGQSEGKQQAALQKQIRKMMKASRFSVVESLPMYKYLSHNGVDTRRMKIISPWGLYPLRTSARKRKPSLRDQAHARQLASNATNLKQDPINVKLRVLYAGDLIKGEALDNILKAAEQLAQDHPEIEFVFSGSGAGMDYLHEQRGRRDFSNIKLMPLQPKVNFIGFLESGDVHLVIEEDRACHVMAFQNAKQAYAAARPIVFVGTPPSETAEDIRKQAAGKIVNAKNIDAIKRAVLHYRQDADDWFATHERIKTIDLQGGQSLKAWRELIKRELSA